MFLVSSFRAEFADKPGSVVQSVCDRFTFFVDIKTWSVIVTIDWRFTGSAALAAKNKTR
jgi:hypothetical protein